MGVVKYLVDELLNLVPQLILAVVAVEVGEGLVDADGSGIAHVGDEVGQVLGALQLNLALVLSRSRVRIHVCNFLFVLGGKEKSRPYYSVEDFAGVRFAPAAARVGRMWTCLPLE